MIDETVDIVTGDVCETCIFVSEYGVDEQDAEGTARSLKHLAEWRERGDVVLDHADEASFGASCIVCDDAPAGERYDGTLTIFRRRESARRILRELLAYAHPDEPEIDAGRETWMQGSLVDDDHETLLRLDAGIGLGSAKLSLVIERDGDRIVWEYVDVATLVNAWASAALDDYRAGDTSEQTRIAALFAKMRHEQPD